MTDAPRSDETTVEDALEALESAVESGEVSTEIYDDDSAMTPMLVVEFDRHTDRADVLRTLFHADGPVKVDSVHDHRAVVRGADR
jgi:hypothetical protein